jgi:hypothetical protein
MSLNTTALKGGSSGSTPDLSTSISWKSNYLEGDVVAMFNLVEDEQPRAPVTLPRLGWLDKAPVEDKKEIAARFAEQRTIRAGIEAWQAITKAESFSGWKNIGAALAIGKAHALKITGANAAWGRNYSAAFAEWNRQHGFDRMASSVRSVAIELHEHIDQIESWRSTLPEWQRRRLIHPLSVIRRWRSATAQPKSADSVAKAAASWNRFVACMNSLPPDVALPLWKAAQAEAAAHLTG